jgi:hypothetical protein
MDYVHRPDLQKRKHNVGTEVLTAVVMNVAIFWDIAPCSPYMNRCFGERSLYTPISCSDDFYPEDGGDMLFRNVSSQMDYTVLYPSRRLHYSENTTFPKKDVSSSRQWRKTPVLLGPL